MDAFGKLQFEMALDLMRKNTPMLMAMHKEISPLMFSYFKELITAGFNPAQAVQIICAHGIVPKIMDGGNGDGNK